MIFNRHFLHESVYEQAGKELSDTYKERPACKLLLNYVLINVRFKVRIGGHISFTTQQILECVKSEDYALKFDGLIALGENIAFPVIEVFDRNKNINLIKATNEKNVNFEGKIKIVVSGYEITKKLEYLIKAGNYPLSLITVEEALKEIIDIHCELKK